ncbi:MAG: 3-ketoacyl-ACP reductase [Bauldia sp.]|nr:MAG: 3-ketoacyl-ACP reductase [Bauldia sp.]MBZ0228051.1 3-ketoacyl-ACP reductase [Bauldia sp.]
MTRPAALITGSDRGIGKGIAAALAAEGYDIALNAPEDSPEMRASVDEIRALGVKAVGCVADVSDIGGHRALLEAAEAGIGPLTTLVNNAGVTVLVRGDMLAVTPESYDRCQAINTRAVFFLTQAFAGLVLARRRDPELHHSIINISSVNAFAASVGRSEYCVSKAAVSMITKCFAARLGPEGVNVYEIQPGLIETAMTAPALADYQRRIADGFTLTRRMGQPSDVGSVAAAMATGRLAYCTGQAVRVDGGMLIPRF